MRLLQGAIAAVAILATGCANLTTVSRSHTLPPADNSNGPGTAIHLDAKQRLAYAGRNGKLCAEPSPDALSAYAASLSGSIAAQGYGSAALAQALSEASGSIGLRTQSITLMRDALYRICELYYSGGLNEVGAQQLIARSQDLTLGVLAIEQLTGAVSAQQVVLNSSASSSSLASAVDASKQLADARRYEADQQKQVDNDKKALADLEGQVQAKQQQVDAAAPADQPPLKEELATLTAARDKMKEQLAADEKTLKEATELRKKLEQTVNTTLASANASASASGQFWAATQPSRLTDASAQVISGKVYDIVDRVLDQNHLLEACIALLSNEETVNRLNSEAKAAREIQGLPMAVGLPESGLVGLCDQFMNKTAQTLLQQQF